MFSVPSLSIISARALFWYLSNIPLLCIVFPKLICLLDCCNKEHSFYKVFLFLPFFFFFCNCGCMLEFWIVIWDNICTWIRISGTIIMDVIKQIINIGSYMIANCLPQLANIHAHTWWIELLWHIWLRWIIFWRVFVLVTRNTVPAVSFKPA